MLDGGWLHETEYSGMSDGQTPDYARSEHCEIAGYLDADGRWRWIEDDDWQPPGEDDLAFGDRYIIRMHPDDNTPDMPDFVQWVGPIDGVSLDDIYDYYAFQYQD